MIEDTGAAHNVRYAILRYFNVAGADPKGRNGQSTKNATHLIKVAIETALGKRPCMEILEMTTSPDGFAVRDYIHVSDWQRTPMSWPLNVFETEVELHCQSRIWSRLFG